MANKRDKRKELTDAQKDALRERLVLATRARLQQQINDARKDPVAFMEFVMRDPKGKHIKLEPFHCEWQHLFHTKRRLQIQASKSHGKTSNLLGYALWAIGADPNIRIKLFAQSEAKAVERLSTVSAYITSNKLYKMVFPHIKPHPDGPWKKTTIKVDRISTDKEPTMSATGIMGSAEGGRADLILLDDISDYRTALVYPQHREAIKKKVYAEILPMLEREGRAISIATPHHASDVISSLHTNKEWDSLIFAVGQGEDRFKPLWPSRWPREALKRLFAEVGQLEYDRAYRCMAMSDALAIIKAHHIRFYTAQDIGNPWDHICVQAYDLAGTSKKKSTYFACVTILYKHSTDMAFVVDAWHDKLDFAGQAHRVVQEAHKWQPNAIFIEETGYQSALRQYLNDLADIPLPIYPVSPGSKSKELRLMDTLPRFETGKIAFNPLLDTTMNLDQVARGDLVTQLLSFTISADQDLGDAFAYAANGLSDFKGGISVDPDWHAGSGVATRLSVIG